MNTTKTMQIRRHYGPLVSSIDTMKTIPATMEAVLKYMNDEMAFMYAPTQDELKSVMVEFYHAELEKRFTGWGGMTYIITYIPRGSRERGVFGFCSAMPEESVRLAPELKQAIHENIPKFNPQDTPRKSKEQTYIEHLLNTIARTYGGVEDIVNKAVITLIDHPAFDRWIKSSAPSSIEDKRSFDEIEFYLDMTRYAFRLIISPDRVLPSDFQDQINKADFGKGYHLQMEVNGPKDYFIYLTDGVLRVALYNGN